MNDIDKLTKAAERVGMKKAALIALNTFTDKTRSRIAKQIAESILRAATEDREPQCSHFASTVRSDEDVICSDCGEHASLVSCDQCGESLGTNCCDAAGRF